MTVQTIATLKTNMPIGVAGGITAQDIHDLIDTVEDRTTQVNLAKTANYTADVADNRRRIVFNSASALTLTLPNSLPEGWECEVIQLGAGQVTVSVAASGTLLARLGRIKTAGQYAAAFVVVVSNASGTAAQVVLSGDTST
jgi:hypothetical protein